MTPSPSFVSVGGVAISSNSQVPSQNKSTKYQKSAKTEGYNYGKRNSKTEGLGIVNTDALRINDSKSISGKDGQTVSSGGSQNPLSQFKSRFFNKEQKISTATKSSAMSKSHELVDKISTSGFSKEGFEVSDLKTFGESSHMNYYKQDNTAFYEAKIAELLPLPSFLLTLEEYNQIPEPQLKNFNHREVSKIKGVSNMVGLAKYKNNNQARNYNKKFSEYCCSEQNLGIWMLLLVLIGSIVYLFIFLIIVSI